jgi:hypothetical protein
MSRLILPVRRAVGRVDQRDLPWLNKYSVDFDGNTDAIDVTSMDSYDSFSSTDYTVLTWFFLDSITNYDGIWMTTSSVAWNDGGGLYLDTVGGDIFRYWVEGYATDYVDSEPINTGEWYCTMCSHDSGATTMNLFVNGSTSSNSSVGNTHNNFNNQMYIGRGSSIGESMDGQIAMFAVWNSVLSSSEMNEIYSAGLTDLRQDFGNYVSSADLVGFHRMGDGLDGGGGTIIHDLAQNNDGTLIGDASFTLATP